MADFFGLNLALTALYAQRRGLDTTGQNIANVNTEGYSRQRAEFRAIGDVLVQTRIPSAGTYGATGRHADGAHRAVTLDGAL